jgi:hypothetical protein
VRIVFEHLRAREHKYLVHVVLTQPVRTWERLAETRERLAAKWKALGDRRVFGLEAGLLTEHVTWSRLGGWHCHYHLLGEFTTGEGVEELARAWVRRGSEVEMQGMTAPYIRVVAGPGEKVLDVESGQGDLWTEAKGEVSKALQYCVRDVCEGATRGWMETMPEYAFQDLVGLMGNVKLHRRLGRWRGEVPEVVEGIGGGMETSEDGEGWSWLGTVEEVLQRARLGCFESTAFVEYLLRLAGGSRSPMAVRTRSLAGLITRGN